MRRELTPRLTVPTTWEAVIADPRGLDALPWDHDHAGLYRLVQGGVVPLDIATLRETTTAQIGFRKGFAGGVNVQLARLLLGWGLTVGDRVVEVVPVRGSGGFGARPATPQRGRETLNDRLAADLEYWAAQGHTLDLEPVETT